jgi:hypothetical protein
MPRPSCGCRYWANQYAQGVLLCADHTQQFSTIAAITRESVEELVNRAISEHVDRVMEKQHYNAPIDPENGPGGGCP